MAMWHRRDPDTYALCAWPFCGADASDRYPVQLCQHHILHIWSLVDADLRESGKTLSDLEREAAEQWENSQHVKKARENAERIRNRKPGWVYFIEVGGLIKIGFTVNVFRRGAEYPPSAELLALYPGALADEQELHRKFAAYRQAGREWYMDCAEIRDHIDQIGAAASKWERGMLRRQKRAQPMKSATPHGRQIIR